MSIRVTNGALLSKQSTDYGINEYDCATSATHSLPQPLTESSQEPSTKARVWVVAACSLIACLSSLILGMVLGFSSPALAQLQFDVPPEFQISADDIKFSLFGAFAPVGAMLGSLVSGTISDLLGRKASLMLSGIPAFVGWLMIALAHFVAQSNATTFYNVLLTGRILTGLSGGWSLSCVAVYISEIASAKLKGLFGNCNEFFTTIGIFLAYFFGIDYKQSDGSYISLRYWQIALIAAGIVIIFEILMLFTYESPRWLFSRHRDKKAIRVLKALRGPNYQISDEVEKIKASFQGTHSVMRQLTEFRHRSVIVPFLLSNMLLFYEGFSGINAALFYASHIFQEAGLDQHQINLIVTISIGVVQMLATLVAVFFVDCVGRKVLLTLSSTGMALSSLVLGGYFYIYDNICESCLVGDPNLKCNGSIISDTIHERFPCNTIEFGHIAVACIVFLIISYSLGVGPISLTSISELMPNRVRSLAGSIAIFVHWMFDFIIALCFKYYSRPPINNDGTWWTFSLIMFSATFMVILFLPETKGHSLEEIQEHFEEGHIFAVSCHICSKTQSKALYSSIRRNGNERSSKEY